MVQVCKGLCNRLKSTSITNDLRYEFGQKWCSECALFFFTEEITCPCCKTKLRTKAKGKKYEMPRM
jgi:uncharacterized paraquat-inducible protein A